MKEVIENTAHQIVCEMIDAGFIESEPEGLEWEFTICEIMRESILYSLGIINQKSTTLD